MSKATCTEDAFLHSKWLHLKVEGEEVEPAGNGVVLLLVAHVRAAHRRLPQTQVAVRLREDHTLRQTHKPSLISSCLENVFNVFGENKTTLITRTEACGDIHSL